MAALRIRGIRCFWCGTILKPTERYEDFLGHIVCHECNKY